MPTLHSGKINAHFSEVVLKKCKVFLGPGGGGQKFDHNVHRGADERRYSQAPLKRQEIS